jgi:hypothetical protein
MSDQQFRNRTDPRFIRWWKSSRSNGSEGCLHASRGAGVVAVADSKDGIDGPIQVFDQGAWGAFVAAVKRGAFV